MTTAANANTATPTGQQQEPPHPAQKALRQPPQYMTDLLHRAADLMAVRWPVHVVDFNWWSEGEDVSYTAHMEWTLQLQAPRIVVTDQRSGHYVCRSLEGKVLEIDPTSWSIDVPDDEIARYAWHEDRKKRNNSGR